MPIYEYSCDRCDQTFEVIQKFSDKPLTTHKGCGGAVKRLLCAPALQFKGTGWYVTDYAHKNGSSPSHSGEHNGHSANHESKPAATVGTSASKPTAVKPN